MSALPAGYAQGIDGPVELQRWCAECGELVLFDDHEKRCLWCRSETLPAVHAGATERRRPMAIALATTCKIDGCHEEAASRGGIYAGLCETHRDEAKANRQPTGGGNEYVDRIRALVPLARNLDRAKKQLEKTGAPSDLKNEFAEASRIAAAQPTKERLERAETAAKKLRRSLSRGQTIETTHAEAERKFKLALGAIAADFRAGG